MRNTFDILKKNREYLLQLTNEYCFDDLNKIPHNFSNSIIWNMGHLLVTEKILLYGLSALEIPIITNEMIEFFKKGTHPKKYELNLWENIKDNFISSIDRTESDFNRGIFINFTEYTTSIDVNLKNFEKTAQYIVLHEGIHTGVIQSIRKQFN